MRQKQCESNQIISNKRWKENDRNREKKKEEPKIHTSMRDGTTTKPYIARQFRWLLLWIYYTTIYHVLVQAVHKTHSIYTLNGIGEDVWWKIGNAAQTTAQSTLNAYTQLLWKMIMCNEMKTTNPTYRSLTIFATYYSIFMCASVSLGTFLSSFRSLCTPPLLLFRIVPRFFLAIWFVVVAVVVIVVFFSFFFRTWLFSSLMNSVARKTRTLSLIRLGVVGIGRLVVFMPFLHLSCIHSSSSPFTSSVFFSLISSVCLPFILDYRS